MNFLNLIRLTNFINFSAFCFIFSSFFFWDLSNFFLQFLILLPLFSLFLSDPMYFSTKKNFLLFLIITFPFFHYVIITLYYNFQFNSYDFIKMGYLYLTFLFCLNFLKFFKNNIKKIIICFILLYIILFFYNFLLLRLSISFDFFNYTSGFFCSSAVQSIFRNNILFSEGSHLGMISVGVALISLYYLSTEKKLIKKIFFFLFPALTIFAGVTTFILGFVISSLVILITCNKKLNFQFISLIIFFNFILIFIIFSDSTCRVRVEEINMNYSVQKSLINENELIYNKEEKTTKFEYFLKKYMNTVNEINSLNSIQNTVTIDQYKEALNKLTSQILKYDKILNEIDTQKWLIINKNWNLNLSNQVFIRSLFIAQKSIFDKFFGWGFENYKNAFKEYRYAIPAVNSIVYNLNITDASNNFFKVTVEYGVFSLVIFSLLIVASFNKNINLPAKIFLIAMILTQFIRGAGYINGGFAMSIFFLLLMHFECKINKHQ